MHQVHVFRLHGRRMWSDAVGIYLQVRIDDLHHELPLGFRRISHARPSSKACSCVVILLETPVTTAEDSRLLAVCTIADQTSAAGTTSKEIFLPELSATET